MIAYANHTGQRTPSHNEIVRAAVVKYRDETPLPIQPAPLDLLISGLTQAVERAAIEPVIIDPEIEQEEKRCTSCGQLLPLSEFYFRAKRGKYIPRCKACHGAAVRDSKRKWSKT